MKTRYNIIATMITACIIIVMVLTGCANNSVSSEEKIIRTAATQKTQLVPYAISADNLPIAYSVEKLQEGTYKVLIAGEEIFPIEADIVKKGDPDILGNFDWKQNKEEIREGPVFDILESAKGKVENFVRNSEIIKEVDKEECIEKIRQTPLYLIDKQNFRVMESNTDFPDAFYQDEAIWVFTSSKSSICEWMFTHELIHYLRELTNHAGPKTTLDYQKTVLDEVMTDIITSSLKPKIPGSSIYKDFYDVGYCYINVFGNSSFTAYFYGFQCLWDLTGRDEFDLFTAFYHNYDINQLAHDCVIFSLAKWQSKYAT